MGGQYRPRLWLFPVALRVLASAVLLALVACSSPAQTTPASPIKAAPSTAPTAATGSAAPGAAPTATPIPLKPLKVEPVKGYVGERFAVTGVGLSPGKPVDFVWVTWDGGYLTQASPETVEFYDRKFTEKRVSLGRATTDAGGQVSASFTVPDDYGEVHDIYAIVDEKDVARGGFRILPEFTMTPQEGPLGTLITVKAKGIGWKAWESTWAVNYDNKYAGFISAVTTRGSATAVIRAAGPVGKHTVDVWHAGQTVPYLNWEQSPQAHIPIFQFAFTVTQSGGPLAASLEWPAARPALDPAVPRTTASGVAREAQATITPSAGPVLSKATLKVTNLRPNAPADLIWVTARGSRTSGLGWALAEVPLGQVTTDKDGMLVTDFQVPDDLGGWHSVKVIQGDKILAEAAYLIEPSLIGVTPDRVKVGETFQVHLKGVGWTELDNIYTVVYDNSYVGFACGFNSSGDVTVNLRASGGPGVHLIDLYPAIYQGHGKPPWLYDTPQLTALQDHPGLALGYRLPIYRLAITVAE
ncbi:MAG: hypothetical protein HYY04_00010 [Chloroflexi bacterium]|nr:hypothetical protein [Chloroflexota bacterium]